MGCDPIGATDRRLNQFAKINKLNEMAIEICDLSSGKIAKEAEEACGVIPAGDFFEVIDQSSPHAGLESLMNIAEDKFAYVVNTVLTKASPIEKKAKLVEIKNIVRKYGKELAIDENSNAEDAFNAINLAVLDGMPCDDTKVVLESSPEKVVWEKALDLHAYSWKQVNQPESLYYEIIAEYIKGILSKTSITYTDENNSKFTLSK